MPTKYLNLRLKLSFPQLLFSIKIAKTKEANTQSLILLTELREKEEPEDASLA